MEFEPLGNGFFLTFHKKIKVAFVHLSVWHTCQGGCQCKYKR